MNAPNPDVKVVASFLKRACDVGYPRACWNLAIVQLDTDKAYPRAPLALIAFACLRGRFLKACQDAHYRLDTSFGDTSLAQRVAEFACKELDDLGSCQAGHLREELCKRGSKSDCDYVALHADPDYKACRERHPEEECGPDGRKFEPVIYTQSGTSEASDHTVRMTPGSSGSSSSQSSSRPRSAGVRLTRDECHSLFIEICDRDKVWIRNRVGQGGRDVDVDATVRNWLAKCPNERMEKDLGACMSVRCGPQWRDCVVQKIGDSSEVMSRCGDAQNDC